MQQLIQQLERVRRLGRVMLVSQRLMQWLAMSAAIAVLCALLDYLLRLPSWLRLVAGLGLVVLAIAWLIERVPRALRFKPDLSLLVLRTGRLEPRAAHDLASAVEFAANPPRFAESGAMTQLAQASIEQSQLNMGGASLSGLLDWRPTARVLASAAVVLAFVSVLVVSLPGQSLIAAQRWLTPLGSAQWPKRTDIRSLIDRDVWPDDTPLPLVARIDKGYREGLRTWVTYRVVDESGQATPWRQLLMSQQARAAEADPASGPQSRTFERLLDVPELAGSSQSDAPVTSLAPPQSRIEFYFEAGDDRSDLQSLELVRRPGVETVRVHVDPPDYALGLVPAQEEALGQQVGPMATAAALQGSNLRVRIAMNKPIPQPAQGWADLLPGLALVEELPIHAQLLPAAVGELPTVELRFQLKQTTHTAIHLQDEFGLTNVGDRQYRLEAIEDRPPTVSLVQPVADEAVLATAKVELEALARDDVGVQWLAIEVQLPTSGKDAATKLELARVTDRAAQLTAGRLLDLGQFDLAPGQELLLTAVAQDVYELDGQQHEPVRSTPRRLRVIDAANLMSQIRSELAGLRQQVIRLADRQQGLTEQEPETAAGRQQQLTRNLETQQALVEKLQARVDRNGLQDQALNELLQRSAQLLNQAQQASSQAADQLQQAIEKPEQRQQSTSQARQEQQRASGSLTDLASLLDQGRDALTLQLQLRQLQTMQAAVSGQTREMLPRTLGKPAESLTAQERQQLEDIAGRQSALSEQARSLIQQMQASAAAMDQDQSSDQAVAQALSEAAAIAQQQGLSEAMNQAAQMAGENRLSDAARQQGQSEQVIEQMLEQLQDQQRRRQEILERRLLALRQKLEQLMRQQQGQLTRLEHAQALAPLVQPQAQLRTNTIAAQEEAREDDQTRVVVEPLETAVRSQASAVQAMRDDSRDQAQQAQERTILAFEQALDLLKELEQKNEQEQQREEMRKLRQAYLDLARTQTDLRERTQPLVVDEQLTRRQRSQLIDLGHQQSDVRTEAAELHQQVQRTLVFDMIHSRIDKTAAQVVTRLRSAQASSQLLQDQQQISQLLTDMADALDESSLDSPFARQQSDQQGGQGGGGGQGQNIPPIAELKLLRNLQAELAEATRQIDQTADLDPAVRRHTLLELGAQQRELAGIGQKLIEMHESQTPDEGVQQ